MIALITLLRSFRTRCAGACWRWTNRRRTMSDKIDYRSPFALEEQNYRAPGRRHAPYKAGEDYDSMVARYGRPHGVFEKERQFSYNVNLYSS